MRALRTLGALDAAEALTPLGRHLCLLPMGRPPGQDAHLRRHAQVRHCRQLLAVHLRGFCRRVT